MAQPVGLCIMVCLANVNREGESNVKGRVRRTASRLGIALLTFVVGIGLSAGLFIVFRHEKCRDSEKLEKSPDSENLETLSICDIRPHSEYEGRRVRIKGTLVGFHELALYDPSCKSSGNYVRVDLDQSSRATLIKLASKFQNNGLREGNYFLKVELVGRLESIVEVKNKVHPTAPKAMTYDTRLVVFSIEQLEPL
jgi:hypothetical protein